MRRAFFVITSSLAAALLTPAAEAATPTVTPAVVKAPGTVEARFVFAGLDQDASVTIAPNSLILPADAYSGEASTVKITGTRVEGGGTLTPEPYAAMESGTCYRGGVFPNDERTYRLDVPAKSTVTVVVSADVPLGLPGRAAGVTLTHGALQIPNGVTTAQQFIESAPIQRTGYVDGVSLKATPRKAGKVTFSGRVIPARRTTVTLVSQEVGGAMGTKNRLMSVDGLRPFTFPNEAFDPDFGLKKIGTAKTTKSGTFRLTLKVPVNTGVAARTRGAHAGSSCGVLGELEPVSSDAG